MKTAAIILAFLLAPSVYAGLVNIDNFNNTNHNAMTGFGGGNPLTATSGTATAAGESLGGFRNISITRLTGDGNDVVNVIGGNYNLNLAADDAGTGLLIWDGDSNNTIDHGLLADLTDGGTNAFIRTALRSDLVIPLTIRVYSGAGNSSSFTLNSPGLGFGATPFTETYIAFTDFLIDTGAGANFTAVTAVTAFVNGSAGLDFQMNYLEATSAPEPATWALVGLSLLGIGVIRRRQSAGRHEARN